jgi:hypothetical protein
MRGAFKSVKARPGVMDTLRFEEYEEGPAERIKKCGLMRAASKRMEEREREVPQASR